MIKGIVEKSPFVPISIFYIFGIVINSITNIEFTVWWVVLLAIFTLNLIFPSKLKSIASIAAILILLGGMNHSRKIDFSDNHLSRLVVSGKQDSIRGMVEQSEVYSDHSVKIRLNNVQIKGIEWRSYEGKLLLTIKKPDKTYIFGDLLSLSTYINHPRGRRNPGEFDYKRYLANHGVYATAYLWDKGSAEIYGVSGSKIRRVANLIKLKINNLINKSLSGDQNTILKAIITGTRGEISDEVEQTFINSGVVHVLAVSGLHVGYVTLIFLIIFGFLRLPRKPKTILTIASLLLYALIVDLKPSVTRAVIMASLLLIGQAWERRVNVYNSLAAAAFIQTLIDPMQLFDIGFQLSFMAVFSIIYIYRRIEFLLPAKLKPSSFENMSIKRVAQLFLVSASALIGTLPITIFYFGRIQIIAILANIIVVPLVSLIGALGFAQVILGFLWNGVNIAYGEIQIILLGLLLRITRFSSQIPFAYIKVPEVSIFTVVIFYVVVFSLLNLDNRRVRRLFTYGFLIVINVYIWAKVFDEPTLRVTFFDVGQGDAAFVEFPLGKKMIVDTGDRTWKRDYGKSVIAPYLERRCINRVDVLALSHPHLDHIGGGPYLLRNFSFGEIWETEIEGKSKAYNEIHFLADSLGIPIKRLYSGDFFPIDNFTDIYILHPSNTFIKTGPRGYNDYSTTFKITFKDIDILFTGDIEDTAEEYLTLWGDYLNSEVLKVPHHGSNTSSTPHFLHFVNPKYAIISVGERNRFDHPSQVVLSRYDSINAAVHRTDLKGAFVIESNGTDIKICSW